MIARLAKLLPIPSSIVGNSGWLLSEQIIRMLLGLVIGVWIARYLGPENYGILNYASALAALFLPFSKLGLDSVVVKSLVNEPGAKDEIIRTAFWLCFVGSITGVVSVYVIVNYLRDDVLTVFVTSLISMTMIFKSFDVVDYWFQSIVRSKYVVIVRITSLLVASIIRVLLVITGADVLAFAWVILVESLIVALSYLVVYIKFGNNSFLRPGSYQRVKNLFKESWYLFLSGIIVLVNMNIDRVMIGEIVNDHEVGLYSAALRLSELWYFIPIIIGASVAPKLIRNYEEDGKRYLVNVQRVYSVATLLAVAAIVPVVTLSESIIHMLFGEEYISAAQVLMIHIVSSVFVFNVSLRTKVLLIEGIVRYVLFFSLMAVAINIVFNAILIPQYGGIGAAVASLISWSINVLLLPLLFQDTRREVKRFLLSLIFWKLFRITA